MENGCSCIHYVDDVVDAFQYPMWIRYEFLKLGFKWILEARFA